MENFNVRFLQKEFFWNLPEWQLMQQQLPEIQTHEKSMRNVSNASELRHLKYVVVSCYTVEIYLDSANPSIPL